MQRIACLTLVVALLSGCASAASQPASAPASPPTPPGQPHPTMQTIILNIGETATLQDGSRLTYLSLVNDSRCAPGVQCIWAGSAEISLRWEPARSGKAKIFSLHTNPIQDHGQTGVDLGNVHIALQTLERGIAPKATLDVAAADKH